MFKILQMLFTLFYLFYLPGYFLSKTCLKKAAGISLPALSLGLSISIIPIAAFGIAMLLRTTVGINVLIITATMINIPCAVIALKKKPSCPLSKEQ